MTGVTDEMAKEWCERLGVNPDSPSPKGVRIPGFSSYSTPSWVDMKKSLEGFFKVFDFYMEKRLDHMIEWLQLEVLTSMRNGIMMDSPGIETIETRAYYLFNKVLPVAKKMKEKYEN